MDTMFKISAVCVIVVMNLMIASIAIEYFQDGNILYGVFCSMLSVFMVIAQLSFWLARFREMDEHKRQNNEMYYLNRHQH